MSAPWQSLPADYGLHHGYYGIGQNTQPPGQASSFYTPSPVYNGPHLEPFNAGFPEFDDPTRAVLPAHNANRIRRRVNPSGEHVKFRRTRSGCYTCRNRRVKCDEGKPICERCRKGNRDCVYPEPPSAVKARRDSNRSRGGPDLEGSSQDEADLDDYYLDDEEVPLSAVDELQSATSTVASASNTPETLSSPARPEDSNQSFSTDAPHNHGDVVENMPAVQTGRNSLMTQHVQEKRYHDLPEDIQFYLDFARNEMSHHHWGVRVDFQNFFKETMIKVALRYDPLLYAMIGFAAYHYTVGRPDGKVDDFLGYYQHAVTLLRDAFKQRPTIATILTVLQLATIEEFLGDWVNLMTHQKAAYTLITRLYTPHRMVAQESLRKVIQWYIRFDVFVGILSGSTTQLNREWFAVQQGFYKQQSKEHPKDLAWKYEERFAWLRLMSFDVRVLLNLRSKGSLSEEEFNRRIEEFDRDTKSHIPNIDPALTDPSKKLATIPGGCPKNYKSIVDPYEPDLLYGGDLFYTNVVTHDFLAFEILYQNQVLGLSNQQNMTLIRSYALKMCQIYEGISLLPDAPKGIKIGLQAGLALSMLWLKGEDEIWWARGRLADIEGAGYTYPHSFRKRLEDLWGVDMSEWWLPNDEGRPRLAKQLRDFVQSQPNKDDEKRLFMLKGIFESLNLSDGSSPDSAANQSPTVHARQPLAHQASTLSTTNHKSTASDKISHECGTIPVQESMA